MIELVRIYNLLFPLINKGEKAPDYYSGNRFINKVREIDLSHPDYKQYLKQMEEKDERKSRKDYFLDILNTFSEPNQIRIINSILDEIQEYNTEKVAEIKSLLIGGSVVPPAAISIDIWNAERLNKIIKEIDDSISGRYYERAITLSYTCMEGFYKSFVKKKIPSQVCITEIIALGKEVRSYLKASLTSCPDEVLTMINHTTHTIDKTRNGFSESHFAEETQRWLAIYIRDLVNAQIRLLLNFI